MDNRTAIGLVARREITTRVRSRAFLVTTALLLVGVVASSLVVHLVRGSSSATRIGVTASTAALAQPLRVTGDAIGQKVTVTQVDQAVGEDEVRAGKLDVLLAGDVAQPTAVVHKRISDTARDLLTVVVRQAALDRQLTQAGAEPAKVAAAVSAATVTVTPLTPQRSDFWARLALGLIAGVLVYIALMIYGQQVAQGVIEEKANRIVELILTAIKPWQLMLGKVLGIGTVGLGQLLVVTGVGAGVALGTGTLSLPSSVAGGAVAWSLVWFVLGFLMYALLFAGAGALVSRQEDAGGATAPILMLIIIPYVLGISILPANPDSKLIEYLSLVPLFSPTLMPMRIGVGIPGWQLMVAVTGAALLIVGLVWLAGRVYANAVLRAGARVRLRDALRAA
jgi:ABC-2 type transport system permease protein